MLRKQIKRLMNIEFSLHLSAAQKSLWMFLCRSINSLPKTPEVNKIFNSTYRVNATDKATFRQEIMGLLWKLLLLSVDEVSGTQICLSARELPLLARTWDGERGRGMYGWWCWKLVYFNNTRTGWGFFCLFASWQQHRELIPRDCPSVTATSGYLSASGMFSPFLFIWLGAGVG